MGAFHSYLQIRRSPLGLAENYNLCVCTGRPIQLYVPSTVAVTSVICCCCRLCYLCHRHNPFFLFCRSGSLYEQIDLVWVISKQILSDIWYGQMPAPSVELFFRARARGDKIRRRQQACPASNQPENRAWPYSCGSGRHSNYISKTSKNVNHREA